MLASKSLLTRPIVSLEEGQKIGTVRGLIVDPKAMEVVALQVDQKGLFREQKVIPFTKVHSIGEAAIIVDKATQVQKATNLPQLFQLFKEKTTVIGNKVLTTEGEKIGIVEEYYIDRFSGKILTLEIRGSFGDNWFQNKAVLPARTVRTLSQEMILVEESSLDQLSIVESPLEETMKIVTEKAESFWGSTLTTSKEWNEKLSQSWDKIYNKRTKNEKLLAEDELSGQASTEVAVTALPEHEEKTEIIKKQEIIEPQEQEKEATLSEATESTSTIERDEKEQEQIAEQEKRPVQ
ncbi:photosystem reaction center subunit H [Heliorestis acidaminivorans]|uniref:Photosystem reaction center subunit H n=1 Tax=Heliorestis acidaminivorans TaxID=553427 RepID=A0A6I0EUP9_9FIRM|nr:PRC-barrel domain-containing protein [Heliorestis acidaminivorans]KAB2953033.1 photosystem reaction center subunit H [Heliorestis acidaminivorans]